MHKQGFKKYVFVNLLKYSNFYFNIIILKVQTYTEKQICTNKDLKNIYLKIC